MGRGRGGRWGVEALQVGTTADSTVQAQYCMSGLNQTQLYNLGESASPDMQDMMLLTRLNLTYICLYPSWQAYLGKLQSFEQHQSECQYLASHRKRQTPL